MDFLNYTPELRDTLKVQDAIKKLIAAYPEKNVIDMETKEQKKSMRHLQRSLAFDENASDSGRQLYCVLSG